MHRLAMRRAATSRVVRSVLMPALIAGAALLALPARGATDSDGDGYPEAGDCDDGDDSVWSLPGEAQGLLFSSKTTLVWSPMSNLGGTAASVRYDTLRSSSPSVFSSSPTASCNDPEGLSTSTTDAAVPAAGHALFYLVRGRNSCGGGSLGAASSGVPRAGISCDCTALCNDGLSCTTDRCSDGVCVHDPVATAVLEAPQGIAVCPGETALFTVRGAPDGSTQHYQWKKSGSNVGTDSPLLSLSGVTAADDGAQITCTVTGACAGTTTAAVTLTVFSSSASCAGGGNGFEAPNGASEGIDPYDPDDDGDGWPDDSEPARSSSTGSVFLFSGEFHLEATDIVIPSRGFDFVWTRSYRSRTGHLTPMGQNWDFSMNRQIVLSSGTVYLYGGTGRVDAYTPGPTGCYTSPGFFRELCPQPDGTWELRFPNGAAWTFHALDGSQAAGKWIRIRDTDANRMDATYDSSGRLISVMDTLGRPITIAYDTDGYVASVADFGGRVWSYHYCLVSDVDCMPGDLKSVTGPPITGTPNGNDFPSGKTVFYTYTRNTGQPALDHNLLTVTQPFIIGNNPPQLLVRNIYTATTNPASPAFDRVQRQVYGDDPFTPETYVYMASSGAEELGAVTKTIVKDRLGNVSWLFYDSSHRLVAARRYTGRAPNPTVPTDAASNLPVSPLRPADPLFFRTRAAYNADALITEISLPKLDAVAFTYDSANTDVKQRANLLSRTATPGPTGADQPSLTETWTYGSGFGTEPCTATTGCGEGARSDRKRVAVAVLLTGAHLCERTAGGGGGGGGHAGGGGGGCGGESRVKDPNRFDIWSFGPSSSRYIFYPFRFGAQGSKKSPVSGWTFPNGPRQSTSRIGNGIGYWPFECDKLAQGCSGGGAGDPLGYTIKGYTVNARSDTYLAPDRARAAGGYPFDPDIRERVATVSGAWTTYTDPGGRTWSRTIDASTGHVTSRTAPPVTIGQPAGSSQFISESWSYDTFGQLVSHTDPLGHVHTASYYSSGLEKGYLESVTVDASSSLPGSPPLALLTVSVRDRFGNATAVTDPNGNTETFTYNALDQLVRHVSAAPLSYATDYRYDVRDNLIRIDEDNRDENGAPRARPRIFTVLGHDPLNRPAYTIVDGPGALDPVGGLHLRTELVYDGAGALTLVRGPAAVSGAQPHDVMRLLRDERELPFRTIQAEGDPVQSTTQYDYDADGGVTAVREGLESSPRVSTLVRDGYGRLVQSTDPMDNVTTLHYDANDHLVSSRVDGEMIDGGGGPNVRLAESAITYDETGRAVQLDRAFFDTATGSPIDDGVATTRIYYDERSQVVHTEDDNGHGPYLSYDGAGRLSSSHDPVGNTVAYAYDGNGNPVTVTETEYSTNPGIPPQVTVTSNTFDAQDRPLSTSQAGVSHSFVWASRCDLPAATLDGRSNTTRYDHDGACRLVATHRAMTTDGTGSGPVSFFLDATRSHDDESRLTSQTDDNGNTTSYAYDSKGRLTATTNPDGSSENYVYDVHDDLVTWTDPNGTVVTSTFDALGRLTGRSVARAPGVLGTTAETWKYDGLSRIVYALNNDALVTRGYNSLSNMTHETSAVGSDPGRNINWIFNGSGELLATTHPSGHNMAMSHDPSGRVISITSTGPGVCSGGPPPHAFCTSPAECGLGPCVPLSPVTTTYDYLGPDRVVHESLGNGAQTEVAYDALRRVSHVTLRLTPVDSIDERAFTWDDDSNKLSRTILSTPGAGSSHGYTYDSASRMVQSVEERPGLPPLTVAYALDGANNRTSVTGGPEAGSYPMSSSVPEPADHQVNQYTSTPWDGARAYDKSGNLVSRASGGSTLSYDYRGRLILVSGSTGSGSYAYDVFGRRVLADGKRFYYDGMYEIEERSGAGTLERLSVRGAEDGGELIQVADVNSDGLPDRVFLHTDDLGNVVVVMDEAGNPLERYDYGDFGRPRFFTPAGVSIPQSAIGNPFLFGGQRFDASTGLYDFRTRHLDPRAGRFVSRDTIGTWGDPGAHGNASVYAGNNPWSSTDPMGTSQKDRTDLYEEFQNGKIPTQDDFADTIDSSLNLQDDGMTSYRSMFGLTGAATTSHRASVFTWTQVRGPFKFSTRSGQMLSVWGSTNKGGERVGRPMVNTAQIGSPLPPSVLSGAGGPLGLSATRGIAVDCRR